MKYKRLVMGLIILISFFLFSGSSESDVCYKCNPGLLGKLSITNSSSYQFIRVMVAGYDEWTFDLFQDAREYLRLNPGLYLIAAFVGPDYNKIIFSQAIILDEGDDIRISIQ